MIEQPYQSALVKLWNLLQKDGSKSAISLEKIVAKVEQKVGDDNWKNGEHWDGLSILAASLNKTGNLHSFGRFYVKTLLTDFLIQRARLHEYWTQNSVVLNETIEKPIIILGLPRSGTSFIFNLLAQDQNHRFLRNWETTVSQIPPKRGYSYANDPRRRIGRGLLKFQNYLAPQLQTIHEFFLDGPEECTPLLMQSFATQALVGLFNVPAYSEWLDGADRDETYRHHKRILQTLQWTYPGEKWLLKSPDHLGAIDSMLKVYPDACFVHLHRNPVQSVVSWASLNAAFRGIYMRSIDFSALGQQTLGRLANDMDRYLVQRSAQPHDRFFDLDYRVLVDNPLQAVKAIYDYFNMNLSAGAHRNMLLLLEQERKKSRIHRYRPENYGLTEKAIKSRFENYIKTFSLPV